MARPVKKQRRAGRGTSLIMLRPDALGLSATCHQRRCPSRFPLDRKLSTDAETEMSAIGTKLTFRLTLDSRGDKASPMRRGTSATGGAWHRGAAPGCCRANRVATPRGSANRSSLRRGRPSERSTSRRHGRPTGVVPRVTTSSSYSTGQLATGRLRNLASSVRCCLPVMRRHLDRTNAVRHFVSGF
jgi:hypothetical protein